MHNYSKSYLYLFQQVVNIPPSLTSLHFLIYFVFKYKPEKDIKNHGEKAF